MSEKIMSEKIIKASLSQALKPDWSMQIRSYNCIQLLLVLLHDLRPWRIILT